MRVGIGLPTQIRDMDAAIIPQWASRAERADSSLATVGRIAYPGVMDTVALAGAAAATSRIGLSSNIMLTTVWPALLLAKELAGIDAMSGGRLPLGVGIGGNRADDFVVDGLPPRHLGRRMDADLEVYHRLWRADPWAAVSTERCQRTRGRSTVVRRHGGAVLSADGQVGRGSRGRGAARPDRRADVRCGPARVA